MIARIAESTLETIIMRSTFNPGLSPIRLLKSLAIARGDSVAATAYAEAQRGWGDDSHAVVQHLRGAVSGLGASDIGGGSGVAHDLLNALRPLTIIGRLPLRRTPPRVPFLTVTGPPRAYWVGESKAARMTAGTYSRDAEGLILKKIAGMTVSTREMLEDQSIEAEAALLADLLGACAEGLDRAFLDRTNLGDAATPAAVTAGVSAIPSTGSALADLDADFGMAVRQLSDAGSNLRSAFWIMPSYVAARLALTRGLDGGLAYPGLGALGGTLAGLPVLCSAAAEAEPNSDDLADITLLDASQISFAEGAPALQASNEATIEMSDSPTGATDAPTAMASHFTSLFQAEATALMAVMPVNWRVRRSGMVQVIKDVPSVLES